MAKPRTAISPTREENYPEWYQEVLKAADLSEHSPVRGCMVIKPWGFAIWENIQRALDQRIKETGCQNAYFPLFIPLSYFEKEAEHIEGFAKECAVVTHHRLEKDSKGKLTPAGELEEPLIVRPTSEMIIGHSFAKWIESYRDLPLCINQWANVVRWEMRTRMFLRTTEFLWQEGHTVHATRKEAEEKTLQMLRVYSDFAHDCLAMPVIMGEKTASERFPGAIATYTIETLLQDRKALQSGTSHFLGQNFSKSCGIRFRGQDGSEEFGWTTSWGVTTRLIGGVVMTHGDDDGLILPPRIASAHLVIIPIIHNEENKAAVYAYCEKLAQVLKSIYYHQDRLNIIFDTRDLRGGEKSWGWIKKGVPLRLEIGMREVESGTLNLLRRDRPHKEAVPLQRHELSEKIPQILDEIQAHLLKKATDFRKNHTVKIDSKKDFYDFFTAKKENEIHGGLALCHWADDAAAEEMLKNDLGVTVRCIPLDAPEEEGLCPFSKRPSRRRVLLAKSY